MSRALLKKPSGPTATPGAPAPGSATATPGPLTRDRVVALQQTAGNAAVARTLARQPVDTDQLQGSRRSIVISEGELKQLARKGIKLKVKLSVRGQVPKGKSDTLDSIVGATEAENVRRKAATIETEFIAAKGSFFSLTPDEVQDWARRHGVKASLELEPFEAQVKPGAAKDDFALPSIDLMKVNVKFEWLVGAAVLELEFSGSVSPLAALAAADRRLFEQFERKLKDARKEMLELEKDKKVLDQAKRRTEDAHEAVDRARDARHNAETARRGVHDKLKSTRQELQKATWNRDSANAAVERARQRRALQRKNLEPLKARDWPAYRKQAQEVLEKSEKEIADLAKKALDAQKLERSLERTLETHARDLDRLRAEPLEKGLKKAQDQLDNAKKAERKVGEMIERRVAKVKQHTREAARIARKGKSWLFKKLVGPRLLKLAGMVAKFIPFVNILSWAADIYELGKILFNLDKLKFGLGGGADEPGGSGSGGTPDKSGKGSGAGTGKDPPAQPSPAGGGGSGSDPWDSTGPPPQPVPGPATGKDPAGGPAPDPQGTGKPGQRTQGTGKDPGVKTPPEPGKPPAPPGSPPGRGTDPAGTHDGPDKPGGKDTSGGGGPGTTGGGKPGQGGGKDPTVKPGDPPKAGAKPGDKRTGGGPKGQGKGAKGDAPPRAADKDKPKKPPPQRAVSVAAVPIAARGPKDEDLFAPGTYPKIEHLKGIAYDKAKLGAKGEATINVHHADQATGRTVVYRVRGVPVRVSEVVVEDLPPRTSGPDSYAVEIWVEVTQSVRLRGTNLILSAGHDRMYYSWEGEY